MASPFLDDEVETRRSRRWFAAVLRGPTERLLEAVTLRHGIF